MKSREILKENRVGVAEKLKALADHPNTPENERILAINKLAEMFPKKIRTNLSDDELNSMLLIGKPYQHYVDKLSSIPSLDQALFGVSLIVLLIVPPFKKPVHKKEVIMQIKSVFPFVKKIDIQYNLDGNYEIFCRF